MPLTVWLTTETSLPIAAISETPVAAFAACLLVGAAVAVVVWWVVQALTTEELTQDTEWRYDVTRINELRRHDMLYRIFQPLMTPLAKLNRAAFRGRLPEIDREIQAAGLSRFWLPEEYLARTQIVALLLLPAYLYLCISMLEDVLLAAFSALLLSAFTAWMLRRRLSSIARRRLMMIKRRMPYLLDLLTLLMQAGSSFLHALKQSVAEFHGHPVAAEFGRVLTDMNMGKARGEAFDAMRRRLADDEIGSIVGAILQGEELGTPLADVFRTQADVLRLKRSQRAETLAAEAGVNMLLPGILVMMACVIVILGPFVLNYLQSGLF